jgi:hypothetical protein
MIPKLTQFLQQELDIPREQVEMASRQVQETPHQLPMALWQYGLVNLWQLEQIFDWLEQT